MVLLKGKNRLILIFVCKYRKKLLAGDQDNDIKSIIGSITSDSDFEIRAYENDMDPIHSLNRGIPLPSITSIVPKLKQEGIMIFCKRKKKCAQSTFGRHILFSSDDCFVCATGTESPNGVQGIYSFLRLNFLCLPYQKLKTFGFSGTFYKYCIFRFLLFSQCKILITFGPFANLAPGFL